MPETRCPVHNVAMQGKDGKYGFFYSHKLDDGTWCNGKAKDGGYQATPTPAYASNSAPSATKSTEVDWDSIAVGKVASNIVNALIAKGTPLADIDSRLDEIFKLAQRICKYKSDLPW